ncbi:MAG TPA: hypothetical protein VF103_06180 [Polyangiaceae bacterium]
MSLRSGRTPKPLLVFAALALALPGCRGCSDDKPYTPFGVESALPDAEAPPAPSASQDVPVDAGSRIEKSVLAPRGSKKWQLAGRELEAPAGFVFDQAVSADLDDDGRADAVAWVLADSATDAAPPNGEAWWFPGNGAPRRLTTLPGFVPTGPTCKLVTALARTGPHTVTVDLRADCQGALIQRSAVRALVALAPPSERPEVLVLRAAGPAPDETLELSAVSVDRDGDGRDDVEVQVSVGSPGVDAPSAPFVWLDRALGPSRDTAEPKKTLERLASREAARAKQKKVSGDVVKHVNAIRRLLGTLCSEGATPRIFDREGGGLACGSLTNVVDSLATAEIGAELTRGRVLEAFGALSRDGWYFGKTSAAARKRLEKTLLDAVKPVVATVSFVDVRPFVPATPHYSPLSFEPGGALVVRTSDGVSRVEPESTNAVPVDLDGGAPRSLDVVTATDVLLVGVAYSCDRSDATLLVREKFWAPGATAPIPTGLLAPRPGACGRARFEATPGLAPIGSAGPKLVTLLGGSVIGDLAASSTEAGAARSPDGRILVVPTSFGILLSGPESILLNLPPGAGAPLRLTDCVPANDGKTAACVADGKVLVARGG